MLETRTLSLGRLGRFTLLGALAWATFVASGDEAEAVAPQTPTLLQVDADHFQVDYQRGVAVWRGNVVLRQNEAVFESEQLTMRLEELSGSSSGDGESDSNEPSSPEPASQITLQAAALYYDVQLDAVRTSGGTQLQHGPQLVITDAMVFDVATKSATAVAEDGGRVHVRLLVKNPLPIMSIQPQR